jgi:hypothetical protein
VMSRTRRAIVPLMLAMATTIGVAAVSAVAGVETIILQPVIES